MEKQSCQKLQNFLKEESELAERRLKHLTDFLVSSPALLPPSILEPLQLLRQHAEEDHSHLLHLQSVTSRTQEDERTKKPDTVELQATALPKSEASSTVLMEEEIEVGVAATDDMFLIDGLEDSRSPQSLTFSDDEHEDSELDEGIHIPRRRANKDATQIAASQPVGIPWPSELTDGPGREAEDGKNPKDIAASIRAMARSVHSSSIFGELPRPRVNTLTKK